MNFKITKTKEFSRSSYVKCPSCLNRIAVADPYNISAINQEYWIKDQDILAEAYDVMEDIEAPRNWEAFWAEGLCENCYEPYFLAELILLSRPVSNDWWLDFHAEGPPKGAAEFSFICSSSQYSSFAPRSWIGMETQFDDVIVHNHYIGPVQFRRRQTLLAATFVRSAREELAELLARQKKG